MKAWFLTGPNEFVLEEIAEPDIKEGYAKIEVLTYQPSVTETVMVLGEDNVHGIGDRIKAREKLRLPGHEFCGRIIEVNPGSRFRKGERVSTLAKILCGECAGCKTGSLRRCSNEELLGVTIEGPTAEILVLPESGLIRVPEELTNSEAANLQPLADCVAAVDSAGIRLGDTVAIFGAGCLGMNTMQVIRSSGAGKVIVVDIKEENLELAKKLGAHYAINGLREDPVKGIKELTDGEGADVVFECAGGNPKKGLAGTAALMNAVKALKAEGELIILAMYGPTIEFPIGEMRTYGKKTITPIFTSLKHIEQGARLVASGQVQIAPLARVQLEGIEKVPEAIRITGNKAEAKTISPAQVHIKK